MQMKAKPRTWILILIAAVLFAAGAAAVHVTTGSVSMRLTKDILLALLLFYAVLVYHKGPKNIVPALRANRSAVLSALAFASCMVLYLYFTIFYERGLGEAYGRVSLLFGLACVALLLSVHTLLTFTDIPLHRVYLILGLSFGLLFAFISVPCRIPDEGVHIAGAYDLSNLVFGVRPENGKVVMRASDVNQIAHNLTDAFSDPGPAILEEFWNSLTDPFSPVDQTLKASPYDTNAAAPLQYLVPAVGLTAGRLLGLNANAAFLLGRFCNLIFFTLLTAFAIKVIPAGKMVLFVLALMPMTLQQAASFSYDAFVNVLSFVIFAMTLHLYYEEEKNVKKAWGMFAVLALASLLLLPTKFNACLAICLFPAVLLFKKGAGKKQRLAAGGLIFAELCMLAYDVVLPMFTAGGRYGTSAYLSEMGTQGYSISYLLSDLPEFWRIFNSVLYALGGYFHSFVGESLGWLSVYVDNIVVLILFALFVVACFRREGEIRLTPAVRILLFLAGLITAAGSVAGMLFTWTPLGSKMVMGVQGRYFICCAPALFLPFKAKETTVGKTVDDRMILVLIAVLFWTVEFLLRMR